MRASATWTTRGGGQAPGLLRPRASQSSQHRHAGISGGEERQGRHDGKHDRGARAKPAWSARTHRPLGVGSAARLAGTHQKERLPRGASSSRRWRSTPRWTRRIAAFSSASSAWTISCSWTSTDTSLRPRYPICCRTPSSSRGLPATCWLRTKRHDDHVSIEIEDECGGLPPGAAEAIFRPFEQRGADRAGLGLGLAISRQAIEADGGTISMRDVPGKG